MRRTTTTTVRALLSLVVLLGSPSAGRAAASTDELVRRARVHEQAREDDLALRRYMDALSLDPTCEEAYLGLGGLRERLGDLREAERVYSVALEHIPTLRAARLARAHVRRTLGARSEASEDLFAGIEDDVAALRALARWHAADGETPAQLAIWRQIVTKAETRGDAALLREARTMVQALVILVGPADPAAFPPDERERGLRRLVSVLTKRGG